MNGSCPPYQCPICGRYLDFKADYANGIPYIHYVCNICNYDTLDELDKITMTNSTPLENSDNKRYSTNAHWTTCTAPVSDVIIKYINTPHICY